MEVDNHCYFALDCLPCCAPPLSDAFPPPPPDLPCRRAERGGGFWSGVLVGGVVCGALGFVFAPQISRALLGDDDRLKLRWDDAADGGEVTKQNLADKIAQLNAAIDDVSSQLNTQSSSSATMSKDEAMA